MADSNNKRKFSTRCTITTHGIDETCEFCEAEAPSTLDRFASGPAFEAFIDQLRQAAKVLTVQDFMTLRRIYEGVWLKILNEL